MALDLTSEILIRVDGSLGHLHLNRPRALNAVSLNIARTMRQQLQRWKSESQVQRVLITGEGDRAFCAGGDVKSVYFEGIAGRKRHNGTLPADLFREEYRLALEIANYPKPYIAYLDGITMGTGVGISLHGRFRIGSEYTQMAMPETAIGFIPDVGASFFFSRLGNLGRLLALTGITLDHHVCSDLEWTTHHLDREAGLELPAVLARQDVGSAFKSLGIQPHDVMGQPCERYQQLVSIADRCFSADTLTEVFHRLKDKRVPELESTRIAQVELLGILQKRSPMSLALTWELLHRGQSMRLEDCLRMEYRVCQACMEGHDFYEGIRAVLVDKDQEPQWKPQRLEQITASQIAAYFDSLPSDRELALQ